MGIIAMIAWENPLFSKLNKAFWNKGAVNKTINTQNEAKGAPFP